MNQLSRKHSDVFYAFWFLDLSKRMEAAVAGQLFGSTTSGLLCLMVHKAAQGEQVGFILGK
jgi:hypothetical protein